MYPLTFSRSTSPSPALVRFLAFLKKTISILLVIITLVTATLTPMTAAAQSASDLFKNAIGTVTVDRGGAYHSQARSIYSLGGGQVTAAGKKITLFSADGPSFNAGCAGISWHFGGFSFISMDEIRQMVEAISQAALGVVVDLAINVICPQCYAVMSTMREMANKMRGQTQDACNAAKNLIKGGLNMLPDSLKPQARMNTCAEVAAAENKSSSILGASFEPNLCGTLTSFQNALSDAGTLLTEGFATWGNPSNSGGAGANKPTASHVELSGNRTYEALSALGYPDGLTKNILLSIMGMEIYGAIPEEGCKKTLSSVASSTYILEYEATDEALYGNEAAASSAQIKTIAQREAALQENNTSVTLSTNKNTNLCFAPPLITDIKEIGMALMCGFRPAQDYNQFVTRMNTLREQGLPISPSSITAIVGMCMGAGKVEISDTDLTNWAASATEKSKADFLLYSCSGTTGELGQRCLRPEVKRYSELSNASQTSAAGMPPYTGLVWFIQDALMQGVAEVQKGPSTTNLTVFQKGPSAKTWVQIVEKSDYPLYRIINLAAVYPGQATQILGAYGTTIAAQHVMATLDALVKTGSRVHMDLQAKPRVDPKNLNLIRAEIANLVREAGPIRQQALQSLNEKRALVDFIVQMNKQLQAEVMSKGLMGNVNMATRLKTSLRDSAVAQASKQNSAGVK